MSITRSSPVQVAAFSTTFSQAPKLVSTSWSKISIGPSHVLAIKSNNTLWAWGINTNGQIGDGTTISRSSPVQLGNPGYTWNEAIAGINYSVGLRGDGLLFTWGLNSSGVLGDLNAGTTARSSPIQIGTSSWVAVSAGGTHVVAIRSDKSLWSWGLNTTGQLGIGDYLTRSSPVQVSSSSWIQVSAGNTHTTAITSNGKLFTWGDNTVGTLGYTTPTQTTYSWTNIAGNVEYTVAIRNDGLLFAWGTNQFGQLGDGTTIPRSSPVQIGTSSWSVVTANALSGGGPTLAIRSDGTLWGWGYNVTGVLGIGDTAYRSSPVQVSGGGSWTKVAASKFHALAINSVGTLYTWGLGTSGQLGLGLSTRTIPIPVTVSGTVNSIHVNGTSSQWISVPAGAGTSGDLGAGDFTLECWTYLNSRATLYPTIFDNAGLLGNANRLALWVGHNSISTTTYNAYFAGTNANFSTSIIYNAWTHLALVRTGTTIKLFVNGIQDATTFTSAVNFFGITTAYIGGSAGDAANCSLNGLISNFRIIRGQGIYTGTFTPSTSQLTTTTIGSTGAGVAASITGTVSLLTAQSSTFIDNSSTNSTITLSGSPIITPGLVPFSGQVLTKTSYTQVSAGDLSSYAIRLDGKLFAWGSNSNGQQGDPAIATTILRSSPTQIGSNSWTNVFAHGSNFVHAIDSNYKLFAWGVGVNGQLGYNDIISRSSPVQISSGNWSTLAVFSTAPTALAIQTDGSLWAWGLKTNLLLGEFSNASYTYSWSQVSAGPSHTAAIRSDGRLYTWGLNSSGQIGNNTVTNTSSPTLITTTPGGAGEYWNRVSVNGLRTIAIRNDSTLWTWGNNTNYLLGDSTSLNRSRPVQIGATYTGAAFSFNGSNQYLSATSNAAVNFATGDFTIEFWAYPTINNRQDWIDMDNGTTRLLIYYSGTNIIYYSTSARITGSAMILNTWQHIAVSRVSGSTRLFIDGVQSGSTFADTLNFPSQPLSIGKDSAGSTYVTGYMSNIRILKGVGLYTSNFSVPTSPLTLVSGSTSLLLTSSTTDSSGTLTITNNNSVGVITNLTPFFDSTSFTQISAGLSHSLAITSLGKLYAWGDDTLSQLGDGATVASRSQPVQIGSSSWSQISSYGNHSLGIDINNKLYGWGDNTLGQIGVSSLPLQWTVVNTYFTTQIFRNDGTVYAMGLNNGGQLGDGTTISRSSPVQLTGSSWSQIVSGYNGTNNGYSIGIKTDGTLYTWGLNSSGILGDSTLALTVARSSPVQVGTSSWLSVSTMNNSAIAIRSDYTMWAWGYNAFAHLGLGDTISRSSPVQIGTSSWTQVNIGWESAMAIRLDGTLWTWGQNEKGQLGINAGSVSHRSSPVQVGAGNSYIQIAGTGWKSQYAIRNDYTLWGWGDNQYGQLGLATDFANRSSPTQVGVGFLYDSISSGYLHAIAKRREGTIWTFGYNVNGQLGDSTTVNRSSPVQIGTSSWISVSAGYNTTFGITVSAINGLQNLYAWGRNIEGQLGLSDTAARSSPVQIGSGLQIQYVSSPTQIGTSSWTTISAGLSNSFAIRSDYKLFSWGDNSQLQSGYITPATILGTGSNPNNNAQSYIRNTDNALIVWGINSSGEIGDGTTINRSSPVQLGLGLGYSQFAKIARAKVANLVYTLGVKTDGTLWSWGSNTGGQLGIGLTTSRSSPVQVGTLSNWSDVAAGPSHALAIKSDGSLWGWGINTNGQVGDNTTVNRSSPVQIGTSSWTAVSAGTNFSTAIRTDGGLFTWGFGTQGQLGSGLTTARSNPVQVGTESYTSISSGGSHAVALRTDLTLYAWGLNNAGQLGDTSTINRSSPVQVNTGLITSWNFISAGASHTSAIDATYNLPYGWGLNSSGQIGDTTVVNKSTPVQVSLSSALNYSVLFTTSTDQLSAPKANAYLLTGAFTMEAFIYRTQASNAGYIFERERGVSHDYSLYISTSGVVGFSITRDTANNLATNFTISLNTWYHIAVTRDASSNITIWVNGVGQVVGNNAISLNDTSNSAMIIGGLSGATTKKFYGYISNARIIKGTALYTTGFYPSTGAFTTTSQGATASEVSLLTAQSSTLIDNSSNPATVTGSASISPNNPFGPYYSSSFNGTNQSLNIANNSAFELGSAFTAEAWIYPTSLPASSYRGIFSYTNIGNVGGWGVGFDSAGTLFFGSYSGGQGNNTTANTNVTVGSIVANRWSHVALTLSGTSVKIYTNGILVATGTLGSIGYTNVIFTIGSWYQNIGGNYAFFAGYISSVRIVKNVTVYTDTFTPPTNILRTTQTAMTNVVALTGTETSLLTLQSATIVDNSVNAFTFTNNNSVSATTAFAPFTVTGASLTWDSIIAGVTSTMGTSNNTLFTWGAGTTGQLGDNTITGKSAPTTTGVGSIWSVAEKLFSSPVQVGTAKSWSLISTGGSHAVATATDNTVWSWGQNNIGQLGDNTTIGKSSPTQIAGNTSSYTFVTAGVSNTFAVRSTTALLFAWGQNNVGQLGLADTANRSSPVQVFAGTMTSPLIPIKLSTVSGSSYTQVQAGSAASVIDSEGRLFTWGTNTNGQVGNNTVVSRSSPVQVGGIQFTYINSPTQVGASSWSQVSAGSSHTLAIDSNSLLYAWGKTPANGDTVTRSSPMQIGANSWINVSTGNDLSLATDTTKTLYAWGLNTNYQLGSPNFYLNQSVTSPVAIGTLAVVQSETTSGGAGNGGFIKNI